VIFFVCEFSIEFKVLFILKFCSKIWAYCNVLRLTVNMRLSASSVPAEQVEIANFSKWILSIGDDNDASDENAEMKVEIPEDLLISDTTNPLMSLIDFVYPDLNDNLGDPLFSKKEEYSHQRLI
jgi:hypothetical protein